MATPVSSVVLTQDIRSAAKDYKRVSDRQHKWELGEIMAKGRSNPAHPRPRKPDHKYDPKSPSSKSTSLTRPIRPKVRKGHAAKGSIRPAIVADRQEAVTDSSCDEEVEEPTTPAAQPDAEIHYSFDAKSGPSHGSQILSAALEAAVDRFESKETDKLVQDEYEVLDSEGEAMANSGKKAGKFAIAEEEEYEFV
jgi:hypothetical protein